MIIDIVRICVTVALDTLHETVSPNLLPNVKNGSVQLHSASPGSRMLRNIFSRIRAGGAMVARVAWKLGAERRIPVVPISSTWHTLYFTCRNQNTRSSTVSMIATRMIMRLMRRRSDPRVSTLVVATARLKRLQASLRQRSKPLLSLAHRRCRVGPSPVTGAERVAAACSAPFVALVPRDKIA